MTVDPLERLVQTAVAEDRLRVVYQPCVRLADDDPVAVEALLRMDDGEGGVIRPDVFIPVAERLGAIFGMGAHVMAVACEQVAWWKEKLPQEAEFVVAINLSPRQLTDPCLVDTFETARGRLDPSAIVLELTEHLPPPARAEERSLLHTLRERGYHLALDDFGSGHASARVLRQLPFDGVKLDRSWTARLGRPDTAGDLARSLMLLALRSGRKVMAEGIETEQDRAAVAALGCSFGQGYLWSRPLLAADMTGWLAVHAGLVEDGPVASDRVRPFRSAKVGQVGPARRQGTVRQPCRDADPGPSDSRVSGWL